MEKKRVPNEAPLGQLLLQAFRWFDESLLKTLANRGWPELSHAQSLVFAHLDRGGTRISELARRTGVSRQAMHRTVGDLEELGLLNLATDPTNQSAKLVILTEKGQANVAAALEAFADIEVELASRIGPSTVQELRSALSAGWGEPVEA
jgi:DNA-binding MarR family transcriptional regulator